MVAAASCLICFAIIADRSTALAGELDATAGEYASQVQPLVRQYCLGCHSTAKHKGDMNLEQFRSVVQVRKRVKPWQAVAEQLQTGQMPPEDKPQPTPQERARMLAWVRVFLNEQARARAGDPGRVPMRRLSNAEYDYTIRDLTGIDLHTAREFPADGAAGEGFTNAAEALTDISPTLLNKYLLSAKEVAAHAVLLPDGFRFSAAKTRRDWTDQSLAKLRQFYAQYTSDGRIPSTPYLNGTLRHRDALLAGRETIDEVAAAEKLNSKYLRVLWQALSGQEPSYPLDLIRTQWRGSTEPDAAALAGQIASWQSQVWRIVPVGSYRDGNESRQMPVDPAVGLTQTLRFSVKPAPNQRDVVLYLRATEIFGDGKSRSIIWGKPRFEAKGKPPLLLRDYPKFASAYEPADAAATKPSDAYGVAPEHFGALANGAAADEFSFVADTASVTRIRLPAALLREREFVVEGQLADPDAQCAVKLEIFDKPMTLSASGGAILAVPQGAAHQRLGHGFEKFRQCFPLFICYPAVIPVDEVVCLKMYHREDQPLIRLFLDDAHRQQIDQLWAEHRFISQQPIAENTYLPLFIGFVTQDQPKELVAYYQGLREPFRRRAEAFQQEVDAAAPMQLKQLAEFTSRAYRRPLRETEKQQLNDLYQALRAKGLSHEDAFRAVLAKVLMAPAFLFRIEQAPPGEKPAPVNDWELATRLSYFLWSSPPDEQLRQVAAAGKLHELPVLNEQARRMLKDPRIRALAIEFGTQWIHVRGFDEFNEKSERLFPSFDQPLRSAMYEEAILLFEDLFQQDRPFARILDADYTYLNETLARHYGIPGVTGPHWRKVDGVDQYGRGGILALGAVQAKQAGAARTSPILRGNWVLETLLGEKLPRPPPDVPRLPQEEGADGLTMRQIVQKHTRDPACATCHQRIDPIGFAFERYDAIGRWRDKESSGLPIDCHAKLQDGTKFEGIDGLRHYLLTQKRDVIMRLFCRRLAGYALGRAVALSDQTLIDEMVEKLKSNNGVMSDAVSAIIESPQFRMIRGRAYADEQ
jgi:hypothetical protein